MLHSAIFCSSSISFTTVTPVIPTISSTSTSTSNRRLVRLKNQAILNKPSSLLPKGINKSTVIHESLRVLEWDKLWYSVASFAGTSLGREATKAQLWSLNQTYKESMRLLDETNAAVEMHKYGGCAMDFSSIDVVLVKSAIQHARRGLPAAIKEDIDWYQRFMPLAEMIMELVVNRPLVKFIQQLIDEDGSIKDSASGYLKESCIS
ncbi:hypothetical protein F0562_014844 [Nyssa sinensis]|uniref:Uncharacterized protein n=1 Tax=Nyssa sinensis TaxID=561372 RepID=A0A5J4ZS87_9ASTE|nr:hypothetical protein F0562_014844 [Nyssa sinensis]